MLYFFWLRLRRKTRKIRIKMTISNVTVCCCRLTLSKSIDEKKHSKLREKKIEKHDFEGNSPNNNYLARMKKIRRDPKS